LTLHRVATMAAEAFVEFRRVQAPDPRPIAIEALRRCIVTASLTRVNKRTTLHRYNEDRATRALAKMERRGP